MSNRTPATSAKLSNYSRTYGGNTDASLLRESRAWHEPQTVAQAILKSWESGLISWITAQKMAREAGVSING